MEDGKEKRDREALRRTGMAKTRKDSGEGKGGRESMSQNPRSATAEALYIRRVLGVGPTSSRIKSTSV